MFVRLPRSLALTLALALLVAAVGGQAVAAGTSWYTPVRTPGGYNSWYNVVNGSQQPSTEPAPAPAPAPQPQPQPAPQPAPAPQPSPSPSTGTGSSSPSYGWNNWYRSSGTSWYQRPATWYQPPSWYNPQPAPAPQPQPAPQPAPQPQPTPNPAPEPAPAPAPSPTPLPSGPLSSEEQTVFNLLNQARQENGLPALQLDSRLVAIARVKAQDMADNSYFSHVSPTYGNPYDMLRQFNYDFRYAGENIARTSGGAVRAHELFMGSSGHRANILSKAYTHVGVATTWDRTGKIIVVQLFARPE